MVFLSLMASYLRGMTSDWFVALPLIIAIFGFTLSLLYLVPSGHCFVLFHMVSAVLCFSWSWGGCVLLDCCCDLSHLVTGVFGALMLLRCLFPPGHSCSWCLSRALIAAVICLPLPLMCWVLFGHCCVMFHLVTDVFCATSSLLCLIPPGHCCWSIDLLACGCVLGFLVRRTRVTKFGSGLHACMKLGWGKVAWGAYWLCIGLLSLLLRIEAIIWNIQAWFENAVAMVWWALAGGDRIVLKSLIKMAVHGVYWARKLLQCCMVNLYILIGIGMYVGRIVACMLLIYGQPGSNECLSRGQVTRIIGTAILLTNYTDLSIVKWAGGKIMSLVMCLCRSICHLIRVEYVKWEHMWNMLGQPKLRKRIFRLRNGKSICRYQWWLGKRHEKIWMESWGARYPGHRTAFNGHLGLGKKAGEDYAAVPLTIKGGGGGGLAEPASYTKKKP